MRPSELALRGNQRLSVIYGDYHICPTCGIVDRDRQRSRVGYPCPICSITGDGGLLYLPLSAFSLIDLMQEMYRLGSSTTDDQQTRSHHLAIVVFFCSLTEVILQHFFMECMFDQAIPDPVQDRLLNDHLGVRDRVDTLFPTIAGMKFKEAIKHLSTAQGVDHGDIAKFCAATAKKRNLFLHNGAKWVIPANLAEECIDLVPALINLFVALHNEFARKNRATAAGQQLLEQIM